MRGWWLVIGLAAGTLLGAGTVTAYGWWEDMRTLEVVEEECRLDAEDTGWCVQRRQRPSGLFRPEVDRLMFVPVRNGQHGDRATYADYPFHNDGLDVTIADDHVIVRGNDGAEVVFPEAFYGLD